MKVSDALRKRHSCRAFLKRDVEPGKIRRILKLASRAPSGANTQPWRVAVATGQTKGIIIDRIETEFLAGNRSKADYQYYPLNWSEPYKSRRYACGMQLYSAVGIGREEKERRQAQWIENYHAFGAPVMLLFYMETCLEAGSYMDFGMFLQSVMLVAVEEGLATCPQAALAEFPQIVKEELGIGEGFVLLCGIALGYEDANAPINQYRTPRVELDEFVTFYS